MGFKRLGRILISVGAVICVVAALSASASASVRPAAHAGSVHKHHRHGRHAKRHARAKHPKAGRSNAKRASQTGAARPFVRVSDTANATAVPAHTDTWAYDDCANGGADTSAALVRQWLSYAETSCGPGGTAKAVSDCHAGSVAYCMVMQYADTNIMYRATPTGDFFSAASPSWWLHSRGQSTLSTPNFGGGQFIDQSDSGVQAWWQKFVRTNYSNVDGLMMDDQSAGTSQEFYGASAASSSEISSDAQLQAAHTSMSAAMTKSSGQRYFQVENTLPPNPWLNQGLGLLKSSVGVHGLIAEGEPMYNGTLDPYYSTLLDQIAYVATRTDGFVVPLSYGAAGASYQQQSRRVQEATILLGYSPGHLVDWADLEQGSRNLAVWPEEGIYPSQPLQSMTAPGGAGCLAGGGVACSSGGHNSLEVAPGVYVREFGACYDRAVVFGGCAALVNTTAAPVTVRPSWLTRSYRHQITFGGGDVQSGGTINPAGAGFVGGSTVAAPHGALLLAS